MSKPMTPAQLRQNQNRGHGGRYAEGVLGEARTDLLSGDPTFRPRELSDPGDLILDQEGFEPTGTDLDYDTFTAAGWTDGGELEQSSDGTWPTLDEMPATSVPDGYVQNYPRLGNFENGPKDSQGRHIPRFSPTAETVAAEAVRGGDPLDDFNFGGIL